MPIPAEFAYSERADFGATASDFTYRTVGGLVRVASGSLTFYDSQTGGNKHTDLVFNGLPVTEIQVGTNGQIPVFQGPPGVVTMWAEDGDEGTERIQIVAMAEITARAASSAEEAWAAAEASETAAETVFNIGVDNDTAVAGALSTAGAARGVADARYQVGRLGIDASTFASHQAALDFAPDGSRVVFRGTHARSTSLVTKSNNLELDASAAEFQMTAWGVPAFLGLRSNNGADDNTYRIGLVRYTGTRGNHTGTLRGSALYCSGSAVWTNGDRNTIEYVRTIGMPTPIFFSSWDGASANDRTGVGNRSAYLEAQGYNFGILYAKQTALDLGNGYCHDDLDDSGGTNPTHAIYGSGADGHRSGTSRIGTWLTERNLGGAAYQFKYADRLTFDALVAHDGKGLLNIADCDDLRGGRASGTAMTGPGGGQGALEMQYATAPSKRPTIAGVALAMAAGVNTRAAGIWADDAEIGTLDITDARTTADPSFGSLYLRGNRSRVRRLRLRQTDQTTKAAQFSTTDSQLCGIDDIDAPGLFLPTIGITDANGCYYGQDGYRRAGAAPTAGTWTRGQVLTSSAPSVGAPAGWVCTTSGTPGTWRPLPNL